MHFSIIWHFSVILAFFWCLMAICLGSTSLAFVQAVQFPPAKSLAFVQAVQFPPARALLPLSHGTLPIPFRELH